MAAPPPLAVGLGCTEAKPAAASRGRAHGASARRQDQLLSCGTHPLAVCSFSRCRRQGGPRRERHAQRLRTHGGRHHAGARRSRPLVSPAALVTLSVPCGIVFLAAAGALSSEWLRVCTGDAGRALGAFLALRGRAPAGRPGAGAGGGRQHGLLCAAGRTHGLQVRRGCRSPRSWHARLSPFFAIDGVSRNCLTARVPRSCC